MSVRRVAAAVLVVSMAVVPGARAGQTAVVDRSDVDRALAARVQADEASRDVVRGLLARDEVRAMAQGLGLDVRRAESAVATLDGDDLRQAAAAATVADEALSGGSQYVTLSLVSLLLIIIIVILLAD